MNMIVFISICIFDQSSIVLAFFFYYYYFNSIKNNHCIIRTIIWMGRCITNKLLFLLLSRLRLQLVALLKSIWILVKCGHNYINVLLAVRIRLFQT